LNKSIADSLLSGSLKNIEDIKNRIEIEVADLREKDICKKLTQNKDFVFHLAANMGGIGYISTNHASIFRNNA